MVSVLKWPGTHVLFTSPPTCLRFPSSVEDRDTGCFGRFSLESAEGNFLYFSFPWT